ncbi:MAG: metallophosphoesterase [Bacillaceae bacterium]
MIKNARANRLLYKTFAFEDFPASFGEINILFITDVHRRKIAKELLEQVNKKIDIVIIGGDLVEKGVPFERVEQNIEMLREIAPVYFVWGNNDYEKNHHELDALLWQKGVKVLTNDAVLFESYENDALLLLGVDDVGTERDDLALTLQKAKELKEDAFKILVSHNPAIIRKVTEKHKIALILAGHTHGGQIRIFGFGPYQLGGTKKMKKTILFVSNGYGTRRIPMRLGALSEAHVITLLNKEKHF